MHCCRPGAACHPPPHCPRGHSSAGGATGAVFVSGQLAGPRAGKNDSRRRRFHSLRIAPGRFETARLGRTLRRTAATHSAACVSRARRPGLGPAASGRRRATLADAPRRCRTPRVRIGPRGVQPCSSASCSFGRLFAAKCAAIHTPVANYRRRVPLSWMTEEITPIKTFRVHFTDACD